MTKYRRPSRHAGGYPRARFLLCLCLLGAGCGRYRDFRLPEPAGTEMPVRFTWRPADTPVLAPGPGGGWDGVDVLNPSVAAFKGRLYNFYSGFDGRTWHTGLAVSGDGLVWTKSGRVLSPDPATWEGDYIAANGSALVFGGEFLYWYQAGRVPRIGLARSQDGVHWRKLPAPVLDTGPRGSWDERGVADPYIIRSGNAFYMFYLGQDRARRQRLGVARSEDGVRWWKLRSNPVLELGSFGSFDEAGLGEPAVWASHGRYWMLYTGRDRTEYRRLGMASSRDGVHWRKSGPDPFAEGGQPWDSKVVCDPSVIVDGDKVRVWFGGGDVARPDEHLHGHIGYADLPVLP